MLAGRRPPRCSDATDAATCALYAAQAASDAHRFVDGIRLRGLAPTGPTLIAQHERRLTRINAALREFGCALVVCDSYEREAPTTVVAFIAACIGYEPVPKRGAVVFHHWRLL